MTDSIESLADAIGKKLQQHGWKLATAESCTAGGVAYALTSVSGSSDWFDCGFITYSNDAKQAILAVSSETLLSFGAVSEQTAREMAEGALKNSRAHASIAITGVAGPTGGTPDKPVGTVWFAFAGKHLETSTRVYMLKGTRADIREQSIRIALETFLNVI